MTAPMSYRQPHKESPITPAYLHTMQRTAILPDGPRLALAVAEYVVLAASEAIAARGRFVLALAGGSTPREAYRLLAGPGPAGRIDWSRVHVFWGDERCVPPDDPASNYRMAREALLDHVPIPDNQVHRMRGEDPPAMAAAAYEAELRECFGGSPRFDLALLGLGDDGHFASVFPGTPAVHVVERWVLAQYVPRVGQWRIALTPPVFAACARVAFVVAGCAKAPALRAALGGDATVPAGMARGWREADVTWFVDEAALTPPA